METLQHCENDALLVDDLLDFSCGDIGEGADCVVTCDTLEKESCNSCFESCATNCSVEKTSSEGGDCLYSPPEEQADLEWLSIFVEESYKGADSSLPLVTSDQWFSTGARKEGCLRPPAGGDWRRPTSWLRMGACSQILDVGSSPLIEPTLLQHSKREWDKRSRSKRTSRSGGRVWSLQRVVRLNEDTDTDDYNNQEASSLDYEPYTLSPKFLYKKAKRAEPYALSPKFLYKKPKKASAFDASMQEGRRCSHCQVQKTPQWRAGPLGPKTLCNACGVRYKSGRLLPEYRPAASPTFVSELHSNSHRKVLEIRTVKVCAGRDEFDYDQDEFNHDQDEFSLCSQESTTSVTVV